MEKIIDSNKVFQGVYRVPGDKSISHRAAILAALSDGVTKIKGYSKGEDCQATLECLEKMHVKIESEKEVLKVVGKRGRLEEPVDVLDAKNSGTTARLLLGVLSGQEFFACLTGDDSLKKRPMKRVVAPLTELGARFYGRENTNKLPICSLGKKEHPNQRKFELEVASAQVKSAIILAGLYGKEPIEVVEPAVTRDHTERMLKAMGVDISKTENKISLIPPELLKTVEWIEIPGDFSSAAFFIAAGVIQENCELTIKDVGINPTRTGFLEILRKMGVNIELKNERLSCNEPLADIEVSSTPDLKPCTIDSELVPNVIDELVLFAVLATQAKGVSWLKDAKELRYKETDRIEAIVSQLKKMGADINEKEDGFVIKGPTRLEGAKVDSFNDHRIAMALAVAGLIARADTCIEKAQCVDISFPGFYDYFSRS